MRVARASGQPAWNDRPPRHRVRDVLWLGLAAAVATGLLHALALEVGRLGFERLVWFPRGFFWMSPLAYAAVFAPGIVVLTVLALAIRKTGVLALAVFAFGCVGAFGLLLPVTKISRLAALLLAAGIGVRLSLAVQRRPEHWIRWSRRFVLASLIALPLGAIWQHRPPGESDNKAQSPAPNVLLVVLDAVRARNALSPSATTTPSLDSRAAEGAVFEWAFSTSPWTLPSHSSMFTGLYPRQQAGDWYTPVQPDARTLAEVLHERGYATGAFVANLHYTAWDSGLGQGFERVDDYDTDGLQVMRSSSYTQTALFTSLLDARSASDVVGAVLRPDLSIVRQHTYRSKLADRVAGEFLGWQEAQGTRPFFAFLNMMDAHLPFHAAEPEHSRYPPAIPRDERAYDDAIRFMDGQLDSLLATLDRRGILDNTVVVVTSDHGELFDQHELSGHANSLYRDVLHVPLLIRYPQRVPAGLRVATPVSQRDLAATLLDLVGVADSLPGTSLRNAWEGRLELLSPVMAEVRHQATPLSVTPASQGDMRALFDDSLHYIVNEGTQREELYAYRSDTLESTNLAEGGDADGRLATWRERLARVLVETRNPPVSDRR